VFRHAVGELVEWCDTNHLELNVGKTKELVVDFRRSRSAIDPIIIKGQPVEIVGYYKYLGTLIDDQLDWSPNVDAVSKKANQRLFFLRKLKQFKVSPQILQLFFQSTIQSVLTFNQLCYQSSTKKADMERLEKIVSRAATIIGTDLTTLESLFQAAALSKLRKVRADASHPLHPVLAACESKRESSQRLRSIKARTNRMKDSFLPTVVRLHNETHQ
jgi:hypothetical protein